MIQKYRDNLYKLLIIAGGVIYITSCSQITNEGGESYDHFTGLEEMDGLKKAELLIDQGDVEGRDAFYKISISNSEDTLLAPGAYDGWSIEWNKPTIQPGDSYQNTRIFSTYGRDKWKQLNYLLSAKDEMRIEDPELTFREFQVAIWALIEDPEFDLNKVSEEELPAQLLENGEPGFNKEKVEEIIANVMAEYASFTYAPDKTYAVFIKTGDEKQDVMIPAGPPTVSHGYVANVTPTDDPAFSKRTYPVIQADWDGPGGDKRWLGWNLGATKGPDSVADSSPESAGWYFSFNFMQGLYPEGGNDEKVAGHVSGPASGPQSPELDSDWIETDPCTALLGGDWRVPDAREWKAVADANAASKLNLHLSGYILGSLSFLTGRGAEGLYWSRTQHMGANSAVAAEITPEAEFNVNENSPLPMWSGLPVRCIED